MSILEDGAHPDVCKKHRPGAVCRQPESCRENGCSAVERELLASEDAVERAAQEIFQHMSYGAPVAWVPGGNSLRQETARDFARAALRAQPAGGGEVERALEYLRPHLDAGTFAAPGWAVQLASILTGGDGCGPATPPESGGQGFMMVPRVASMGIRGVLYRTRSGYGDDYMTPEQADALWADLLAAAPAQPDGVSRG